MADVATESKFSGYRYTYLPHMYLLSAELTSIVISRKCTPGMSTPFRPQNVARGKRSAQPPAYIVWSIELDGTIT